jgi:hypothetical protein
LFIAAPYWADIDNSVTGEIWYETHTAESGENSTESNALLEEVSAFIRARQGLPSFGGSWMLVATWNESFPFNPSLRNVTKVRLSIPVLASHENYMLYESVVSI